VAVVFVVVIDIGPSRDRELGWCNGGRRWSDKIYPSILKINPNPNTNQTHLDLNLATVDGLERVTRWKKEREREERD
jgi:hypothetical protein